LELFTNTKRDCSISELAEFYANCVVTNGVVTSTINGHKLHFDASDLGELPRVPTEGFDVYVCEGKSVLGDAWLLELTQRLARNPHLTEPHSVRKGEMTLLHRFIVLVCN